MLPLAPVLLMASQVAAVSNPALGHHSHRAPGHTAASSSSDRSVLKTHFLFTELFSGSE